MASIVGSTVLYVGFLMFSLSPRTGCAILALACLEGSDGQLVLARQLAKCTGVPQPYLAKILHALGRAGLVTTKRGYRGGYTLARPANAISLLDVADAMEGNGWLVRCVMGLSECSDERSCPVHTCWKRQRERIAGELAGVTIVDVARFERGASKPRLGTCCDSEIVRRASHKRKEGKNGSVPTLDDETSD